LGFFIIEPINGEEYPHRFFREGREKGDTKVPWSKKIWDVARDTWIQIIMSSGYIDKWVLG
jgi:hypothetical protein